MQFFDTKGLRRCPNTPILLAAVHHRMTTGTAPDNRFNLRIDLAQCGAGGFATYPNTVVQVENDDDKSVYRLI